MEGRGAPVGIRGCADARMVGQLGRMRGRRSRCSTRQTGSAEYGAPGGASSDESVAEVLGGALAGNLARSSAGVAMLLGAAVGEAAFGNARPVHFALRDSHGDLGGSVLVACVVAEAHRSPWAWGPVLPGLPSARVRGILAARVLLVQRREQIVAGGAVLLRRERRLQVAPLRRSDAVARAHVRPSAERDGRVLPLRGRRRAVTEGGHW